MHRDRFPPGVADQLKWYVYRLIDPRNGETFYVGKGQGDRIFEHAKAALSATKGEDAAALKFQRIKDISAAGLDVAHLIHRHNIENEDVAFQIEAALIDAYSSLTNKVSGHGAGDYGCRHVEQIVSEYAAKPFAATEPLILISIAKSYDEEGKDIYDAVRGVWRIDVKKAKNFRLVLAHRRGLVLGAFRPREWLPATKANFPWLDGDIPGRSGFVGKPAEQAAASLYIRRRVPDVYRAKGAANPVRFIRPQTASRQGQKANLSESSLLLKCRKSAERASARAMLRQLESQSGSSTRVLSRSSTAGFPIPLPPCLLCLPCFLASLPICRRTCFLDPFPPCAYS